MSRVLFALTVLVVVLTCEMLAVNAAPLSAHLKNLKDRRAKRDVTVETAQGRVHATDREDRRVESAEETDDVVVEVDSLTPVVGDAASRRQVRGGGAGGGVGVGRRRSRRSAVWLLHATMHLCEVRPLICSIKVKNGDTEVDIRLESE